MQTSGLCCKKKTDRLKLAKTDAPCSQHNIFLEFGREVDQDIAAQKQPDTGKRRLPHEIILPENHYLPQCLDNAEAMVSAREETVAKVKGNSVQQVLGG